MEEVWRGRGLGWGNAGAIVESLRTVAPKAMTNVHVGSKNLCKSQAQLCKVGGLGSKNDDSSAFRDEKSWKVTSDQTEMWQVTPRRTHKRALCPLRPLSSTQLYFHASQMAANCARPKCQDHDIIRPEI